MTQYDIGRIAHELIEVHCGRAADYAAQQAERSRARDDNDGCVVWQRVVAEIHRLRGTAPRGLQRKTNRATLAINRQRG